MKPIPRELAEQVLRGERPWTTLDAFKRLPHDVDPALGAAGALRLLGTHSKDRWIFCRNCQALPEPVVEALLALLEREASDDPFKLFVREAMRLRGELPLREAWASALTAMLDLESSYAWGSKQKKAKFKALAQSPRMVAAAQAAVVGGRTAPAGLLAVLARHGGEEAADALLTVFSRGGHDVRLEELSTHAADTPAMTALLSSVTERLERSAAEGPFAAFSRRAWGFDPGRARVHVMFGSVVSPGRRGQGVPRFQGGVLFQSDGDPWWSAWLSDLDRPEPTGRIFFSSKDAHPGALGLAPCAVEQLPAWLAGAARKLDTGGWREPTLMGSLRGKKREVVVRWLFGG